ncbi:response regulator transcription factor [Rhizobium calliandrae]|uniref:Response regulator transcription factor n=1 Tax=Rhizobium calliandrae TaxID=1312182 RepID=A0ABT7KKM1_9HYPH|nr:response regulator transcription factor [Rhizobium calliandrae]MDL2409186.1 response regulator transcription factor [Rhizobium calliandrae]
MRILLIEDDPMVGRSLSQALADAGMSVDWVADGRSGEEALLAGGHAVALLDLGLPGSDGIRVLENVRRLGISTPIVVITARDDLDTRVKGLDSGGDDFVVKPFEVPEILARIRAVLRRHAGHATSRIGTSEIVLDLASHELSYRGQTEMLPAREFALMRALAERPGTILSRSQIEDRVYGWGQEVESNAVDVLIHYIRRRFGKDIIRNVRGAGWLVMKS